MIPQHQQQHSLFKLSSTPVFSQLMPNNIFAFGLADQSVELVDLNKFISKIIKTQHTKRINMVRMVDQNIMATCSNDGYIKLWDSRQNYQPAFSIKKKQEIYSLAMDQIRLVFGECGKITFWDTRNNKQITAYQESFTGDVTDLRLRNNKMFGCGTEGMVASFDLSIQVEEDATEWTHIIDHPAQSLRLYDNYTVLTTTDHLLIALNQQIMSKKIEVNSGDEPRHLLWSDFKTSKQQFSYFTWNINDGIVQRWEKQQIRQRAQGVQDIDFLEVFNNQVIGVNSKGYLFSLKFNNQKPAPKQFIDQQKTEEMVKPKYNKIVNKKKFQPI